MRRWTAGCIVAYCVVLGVAGIASAETVTGNVLSVGHTGQVLDFIIYDIPGGTAQLDSVKMVTGAWTAGTHPPNLLDQSGRTPNSPAEALALVGDLRLDTGHMYSSAGNSADYMFGKAVTVGVGPEVFALEHELFTVADMDFVALDASGNPITATAKHVAPEVGNSIDTGAAVSEVYQVNSWDAYSISTVGPPVGLNGTRIIAWDLDPADVTEIYGIRLTNRNWWSDGNARAMKLSEVIGVLSVNLAPRP